MPHLRLIHAIRACLLLLLLLAAAMLPSGPALAQSSEAFSVRKVQVDVSAANVNVARDLALAEGQRQAFQTLLQRLTAPADWPRLPKLADKDVQDIVLDVGIDQEKRSSVRYLAILSVRFKPEAVRRLLRGANIAYAEWRGRPVAVVPVYQSGDAPPVVWEQPNPWRDAWKSGGTQGVVPLVVPQAPPADADPLLAAPALATAPPEALAALSQRYNTQEVVIAVAKSQPGEAGKLKLEVTLTGNGPVAGPLSGTRSYAAESGETVDSLVTRAVADITKSANDTYKTGNLLQFDRSASIAVTVPLDGSMADWTSVREKLVRSTPVRGFDITAISRTQAGLVLRYVGDQQQLEQVFVQNGLVLTWVDDHWVLQSTLSRQNAGVR